MGLFVRFDNDEGTQYPSTEMAEQAIQDVICNGDAENAELLQGQDAGTAEVVAEYDASDFGC